MKGKAVALVLVLAACTPVKSNNAYVLASALTAAERSAIAYMALPMCGGGVKVCSDPAIKTQIKQADMTAYAAVKRAEAGDSAAAVAAQVAITTLINTIPRQAP